MSLSTIHVVTSANYSTIKDKFKPLDMILFKGTDVFSDTICIVSQAATSDGDFSHCGLLVNKDLLPTVPQLQPDKWYVWESTFSAVGGFLGKFGDGVPDIETNKGRLGVQIRDFEEVVTGYTPNGGKVAWAPLIKNPWDTQSHRDLADQVSAIHDVVGNRRYDLNCCGLLATVIPCLRVPRDVFNYIDSWPVKAYVSWETTLSAAEQQKINDFYDNQCGVRPSGLKSHSTPQTIGSKIGLAINNNTISGWLFCSELVALVYQEIGLISESIDPQNVIPVDFLGKDVNRMPAVVLSPTYVVPDPASK